MFFWQDSGLPTRSCLCTRLNFYLFVFICVPLVLCPVSVPVSLILLAPIICWHHVLDSKENVSVIKVNCILGI